MGVAIADRKAFVYALPWIGLLIVGATRTSFASFLGLTLFGALLGGAILLRASWYARHAWVEVDGANLVLQQPGSGRQVFATRARGRVAFYTDVRGGAAVRDRWLLWFDDDGTTSWTTFGRTWPVEELVGAAEHAGVPVHVVSAPMSVTEIRRRHPDAVPWLESRATAVVMGTAAGTVLVLGVIGALL